MAYTTVSNVAQMFPMLVRNGPRGPSDTLIQQLINDVAGEIDAILQRRFSEAFATPGFTAWIAALSADATNLLEKINRFGACGELADIFEANGVTAAVKLSSEYDKKYEQLLRALNARDENDRLVAQGGDYDYLFDSLAKVETPRALLKGVAGGDQQPTTLTAEGMFSKFGRDDPHGT